METWLSKQRDARCSLLLRAFLPLLRGLLENSVLVFEQLIGDGVQEYRLRKMLQLQLRRRCEEPHRGYHRCRERDAQKKQLLIDVARWIAAQFRDCAPPIHAPRGFSGFSGSIGGSNGGEGFIGSPRGSEGMSGMASPRECRGAKLTSPRGCEGSFLTSPREFSASKFASPRELGGSTATSPRFGDPASNSSPRFFGGNSLLECETPAVYWSERPFHWERSFTHWTLSFVPAPAMKLSILAGKSPSDREPREIDLCSLTVSQGSQTVSLPYSTLCPAFNASSNQIVTVHVIVDCLIGYLWVLNEDGKIAGSVVPDLPSPLWLGIAGSCLPSGIEVCHVGLRGSEATLQFAQSVRSWLHELLEAEIAFYRAQESAEDSNRVRFHGKQMPFWVTFYLLLRVGSEGTAGMMTPSLLFDVLEDLKARMETVQRFPELFADPWQQQGTQSGTQSGEKSEERLGTPMEIQMGTQSGEKSEERLGTQSGTQSSQQDQNHNENHNENPTHPHNKNSLQNPLKGSNALFVGSHRFEGEGVSLVSSADGNATLQRGEEVLQGQLHKFGWFLANADHVAVATRGSEGVEVVWFPRSGRERMEIMQLRGETKREATLQGMRSICLFVDLPRWIASRLMNQAKAGNAQFEHSLQGDPATQFLLLPLFGNGWNRSLRMVLWEEGLNETVRRSQFLKYVADPELPVKQPVIHTQNSALLGHVQKIETCWRPSMQQVVIVETEKNSPFLNPKRAFFAITNAIYQELKAILQFHSHFENGSEVIQAANNLLRFINDDRTRHGKKWADFESLPGKLRVLLKRVFPAGLTVSECQKCLKQIIPQIDTFLSSLPLLYDYQAMTLRTLFAFELDNSLLLEDVSAPFVSQNHGNSVPSLFITRRVSTLFQNETPIRSLCVLLQALRFVYSDSLRSFAIQFLCKWEFHWKEEGNVELLESLCLVYQIIECVAGKGEATSELIDFLFEIVTQLKRVRSISLDAHVLTVEHLFSQWFHRMCFILLYSSPSVITRSHLNRFISFLKLPLEHEDAEFLTSTLTLLIRNGSLDAFFESIELKTD